MPVSPTRSSTTYDSFVDADGKASRISSSASNAVYAIEELSLSPDERATIRKSCSFSVVWIYLLLLAQCAFVALGLMSCMQKDDTALAQYSQLSMAFNFATCLCVLLSDPLKPGLPTIEILSCILLIASPTLEGIHIYMKEGAFVLHICYGLTLVGLSVGLFQKRRNVRSRLNRAQIENHVVFDLPISFLSSMLTIAAIGSDSVGCIMESLNHSSTKCWDVVTSNHSLTMVVVTLLFIKTYQAPFVKHPLSILNIVRFDFPLKNKLQLVSMMFGIMCSVYLFASKSYLEQSSASLEGFGAKGAGHSSGGKSLNRLVRVVLLNSSYAACSFTFLCSFFRSKIIQPKGFKSRHSTVGGSTTRSNSSSSPSGGERDFEAAPIYRGFIFLAAVCIFASSPIALYFAYVEDELMSEKMWRSARYCLPALVAVIATYVACRTRQIGKSDYFVYMLLPAYLFLFALATAVRTSNFLLFVWEILVTGFSVLLIKVTLLTKSFLLFQTDEKSLAHLTKVAGSVVGVAAPIFFLISQSVGCILRYSNPDPDGDVEACASVDIGKRSGNLVARNGMNMCPLAYCDDNGTANTVVSFHVVFTFCYVSLFGFTRFEFEAKDLATLTSTALKFSFLTQILLFYVVNIVTFMVYGCGGNNTNALDELAGTTVLRFVCSSWAVIFLIQGLFVGFEKRRVEAMLGGAVNALRAGKRSSATTAPSRLNLKGDGTVNHADVWTNVKKTGEKFIEKKRARDSVRMGTVPLEDNGGVEMTLPPRSSDVAQQTRNSRRAYESTALGRFATAMDSFIEKKMSRLLSSSRPVQLARAFRFALGLAQIVPWLFVVCYYVVKENSAVFVYIAIELRVTALFLLILWVFSSIEKSSGSYNFSDGIASANVLAIQGFVYYLAIDADEALDTTYFKLQSGAYLLLATILIVSLRRLKRIMIATFSDSEKLEHLVTVTFSFGILGSVCPVSYLFAQNAACAVRTWKTGAVWAEQCQGISIGVNAIEVFVIMMVARRIALLPLLRRLPNASSFTFRDVVRMDLSLRDRMYVLVTAATTAVVVGLYNIRKEGPGTDSNKFMQVAYYCMVGFSAVIESWRAISHEKDMKDGAGIYAGRQHEGDKSKESLNFGLYIT